MKAYLYEENKNGRDYICAKFDNNSNERVTILYGKGNFYQPYLGLGDVEYGSQDCPLEESLGGKTYKTSVNEVGDIVNHVWRPGIFGRDLDLLKIDIGEKARAKRELKILIESLHEILMYIEPSEECLKVYGHKTRELLILACTECESLWTDYIRLLGNTNQFLTTRDYVKLKDKLFLKEYVIKFTNHPMQFEFQPFVDWDEEHSTTSLPWYDGYNKTKHNKKDYFSEATLENCLKAIAANIVMFCVRYSPFALINAHDICSNLVNEYFSVELKDPDITSFYIPPLKSYQIASGAFSAPADSVWEREWNIKPLT